MGAAPVGGATARGVGARRACQRDDEDGAKLLHESCWRNCGHRSPIAPVLDLSQPLHLFVDKVVDGAQIMLRQPQRAAWNHLR